MSASLSSVATRGYIFTPELVVTAGFGTGVAVGSSSCSNSSILTEGYLFNANLIITWGYCFASVAASAPIIAPAGRPGGKKKKFKKEYHPENHRPPGTPLVEHWAGMIWPSDKPQIVVPPPTSKGETPLEPYRTPAAGPQSPSPEVSREFAKRMPKYKLPEFYRAPILNYAAAMHRERILAMVKQQAERQREEEDLLVLIGAFDD